MYEKERQIDRLIARYIDGQKDSQMDGKIARWIKRYIDG